MGVIGEPQQNNRQKALEELRSNKVGVLLHIIDELDTMNISIKEIETILGTCGLNADCAVRFGRELKEKGHRSSIHP